MFGDIGSGCGRLVVAQALTWPWRACRGVEIVPSLHDMAEDSLAAAGRIAGDDETNLSQEALGLLKTRAPCSLSLGDVNDEVSYTDGRQHCLWPYETRSTLTNIATSSTGSGIGNLRENDFLY